jgi:prepilin-type N-terminal cleavage/methylation domain-containing protein
MMTMIRNNRSQSGHTLVEMIVVMAIALVIILASFQMLEETTRVTLFIESRNDLPLIAQSAVNYIQTAVGQSRLVFDSTATGIGPGYFAAVTVPVPMVTNTKMPLVNTTGEFVADTAGNDYTGNCLLIARQLSPLEITYTGGMLSADRYRFEMFYLTRRTNWSFSGSGGYIDAMRARSVEYADYFQLSTVLVSSAQRTEIINALRAANVTLAWNPGQPINNSVYNVTTNGSTVATAYTLNASPTLALADAKSLTPQINNTRIFGKMNYSIAFRPSATTTYPITTAVPKYARWNSSTPLFPSGMEFLIVGNSNNQRVLTRMAIMAHYRANEYASQEASVITSPN